MKSLYLLILLFSVSFPLIRSFEPKIYYFGKWKSLLPGMVLTAGFFVVWDVIFTKNGVWGFNESYYLGLKFLGLPIEEWLFFFIIPFASVFIYECVIYFFPSGDSISPLWRWLSILFTLGLLLLSFIHFDRAYTFYNFLFASIATLSIAISNPKWSRYFWISYFIHLIPFLIVNGVLTGAFTAEPIVWYDNAENLAVRIFTIPVEDTIYALLLLLMNVIFYERMLNYYGGRT